MPCAVTLAGVVGAIVPPPATAGALVFARPKSSSFAPDFVSIDVAGLQIAMDDAGAMRRVERRRHLDRDRQGLGERQRALRQPIRQRFAVEQFHDEERRAVVLPTSYSVQICGWVSWEIARASRSKRSRNSGSAASASGRILTATDPVEPRVPRAVDLAHAARAEG